LTGTAKKKRSRRSAVTITAAWITFAGTVIAAALTAAVFVIFALMESTEGVAAGGHSLATPMLTAGPATPSTNSSTSPGDNSAEDTGPSASSHFEGVVPSVHPSSPSNPAPSEMRLSSTRESPPNERVNLVGDGFEDNAVLQICLTGTRCFPHSADTRGHFVVDIFPYLEPNAQLVTISVSENSQKLLEGQLNLLTGEFHDFRHRTR